MVTFYMLTVASWHISANSRKRRFFEDGGQTPPSFQSISIGGCTIENRSMLWQNKAFVTVMALICTVFWGSATPSIKIGYEIFAINATDIPSKLVFAGNRFLLAGFIVLAYVAIKHKTIRIAGKKDCLPYLIMGVLTLLQYIFFYIGLTYTTGVKGSLFSVSNVFIIVLISPLVNRGETLTVHKLLGCLVALCGLLLITTSGNTLELSGFCLVGEGFVIFASLCHAISFYFTKSFAKTRDAGIIAGFQLLLGGVFLLIIGFAMGGSITYNNASGVLVVCYLALASSMAYLLWSLLLATNPISTVSMYNLFTPVFGALFSGLMLGETILSWKNFTSLSLVAVGVWLVNTLFFQKGEKSHGKSSEV